MVEFQIFKKNGSVVDELLKYLDKIVQIEKYGFRGHVRLLYISE